MIWHRLIQCNISVNCCVDCNLLNLMTVNWNFKTWRMRILSVFKGCWGKWRAQGRWKCWCWWNRRLGRFCVSFCTPKCNDEVSNYTRQEGNWSWNFSHLLFAPWTGWWKKGSFCFVVYDDILKSLLFLYVLWREELASFT